MKPPAAIARLVADIHATPQTMTMDFAGAGATALAWLHAVGGSSRTVLEATDRYAPPSLIEAVGFVPERFTSRRVARALAAHAHARARHLAAALTGGPQVVFGLGSTATIATDRTKRGDHRAAVAVRDPFGESVESLVLHKGARDRAGEEALVSAVILRAVADACGVLAQPELPLRPDETVEREFHPAPELAPFAAGERAWARLEPDGSWAARPGSELALLSGSFHPLHEGHRALAHTAGRFLGREAAFELSLRNAEKDDVPLVEVRRRAAQFTLFAPLLLSRAPRFHEKAALFPGSVFVVGADTAARVIDPRFYRGSREAMERALAEVRAAGCRFLVAGRLSRGARSGERFVTLRDLQLPAGFEDLFEALPERAFRRDVSSSAIRRSWPPSEPESAPESDPERNAP